jgi:anti-sigma B factor antagonist
MIVSVKSDQNNVAEVAVSGPITQSLLTAGAEPLTAALGSGAYSRQLLLDLRQTEHIDTSGINWLLIMHRRAREAGGRLILFGVPPMVDNVIKVLRMNSVFEIAPTREDAERLLKGDAS